VQGTVQFAKGVAAEKDGNDVTSLVLFFQSVDADNNREALAHIQNFAHDIPTGSVRERANYAAAQKAKWEKIFADLKVYLKENLAIVVQDFSKVEDRISTNTGKTRVAFTITPGVQIIPNRTALSVWKTVMDNWDRVRKSEDNKAWATGVRFGGFSRYNTDPEILHFRYQVLVGLFDGYGDRLETKSLGFDLHYFIGRSFQVLAQQKYYTEKGFRAVAFGSIPVDDLTTDTVTPRIIAVADNEEPEIPKSPLPIPILTVPEWNAFLQGVRK
jgi:hypothetical protein